MIREMTEVESLALERFREIERMLGDKVDSTETESKIYKLVYRTLGDIRRPFDFEV